MDIKVNTRSVLDKAHVVEVQGEIDVYTSPRVKEMIIGALKKVREHEGRILLICTNPQIKKIFNITGLVKIFEIYKDEEEALKALA